MNPQHPLDVVSPELRNHSRQRDAEGRIAALERRGGSSGGSGTPGPPGPPGVIPRGAWAAGTAYVVNDTVTHDGSWYRRKVSGTSAGTPPSDTANWELLVSKGDAGPSLPVNELPAATDALSMNAHPIVDLPPTTSPPPADPGIWALTEPYWAALPDVAAVSKGLMKILMSDKLTMPTTSGTAGLVSVSANSRNVSNSGLSIAGAVGSRTLSGLTGVPTTASMAANKAYVDSAIAAGGGGSAYDAAQIGTVLTWSGKTNPTSDYALLNGQSLTKAAFPQGYAFAQAEVAAGNTDWTVNTTAETFTVPNYSDRFIFSHGAKALTTKGGSETHTLTEAQLAQHSHPFNGYLPGAGGSATVPWPELANPANPNWGVTNPSSPVIASGGGQPHNNMPPYVVLAHFVKVRGAVISGNAIQGPPGPVASVVQEDWHSVGAAGEPAFVNGWGATAQYRKDPRGVVSLRGTSSHAAAFPGAVLSLAFTLPAGYRPVGSNRTFMVPLGHVSSGSVPGAWVDVKTNGEVSVYVPGTTGTATWIDLSAIEFDTGQTTFPAGKSVIPTVTALPAGATTGDEVKLLVDPLALYGGPYVWHFQYEGSLASNRWIAVGGQQSLLKGPNGAFGTVGTTMIVTGSPIITAPVSGVYRVRARAVGQTGGSAGAQMLYQPMTTTLTGGLGYEFTSVPAGYNRGEVNMVQHITMTAGQNWTIGYSKGAAGQDFGVVVMVLEIEPLRVGG